MNKKIISSLILFTLIISIFSSTCHASASAKVFSSSKSSYYQHCATYAVSGFTTLGYTCTSSIGQITRSNMLSWIGNTGNGYGMYVHTFGGDGYFNDYNGYSIDSSMISGYWDFVYIDSSKSALNSTLADAFHTTGYTNKCFLGWSNTITTGRSETFNYYFWLTYIDGSTAVRIAAINAAAHVPGSASAPIKLYGSTTYTGVAR